MSDSAKDRKESSSKGKTSSSSSVKGKAPVKKQSTEQNKTSADDRSEVTPNSVRENSQNCENRNRLQTDSILECLKQIQSSQLSLAKRMDDFENYQYDDADQYPYEDPSLAIEECDRSLGEPAPKKSRTVGPSDYTSSTDQTDSNNNLPSGSASLFTNLSNKFKPQELVSADVDPVLADNVQELFLKGMSDEQYEQFVKTETSARPGNVEALSEVRLNKLIWDVISSHARTNDKKLQAVQMSVVKAGVHLTKTMNNVAQMEKKLCEAGYDNVCDLNSVIEGCNDALAFMGHANHQINMTRKDFLRPELRSEYTPLCSHSIPFSKELFGDDVAKIAKEIEDANKMGNRLQCGPVFRGRFRGRFRSHFRGRRPPYGRGYGRGYAQGSQMTDPKNMTFRRGGVRK